MISGRASGGRQGLEGQKERAGLTTSTAALMAQANA